MATLRITQRKSGIGTRKQHRATLQTLGLKKIGQSVDKADSGSVRGMLRSVAHLISFEEVAEAPPAPEPAAKAPATPAAKATSGTKKRTTKTGSSTTRKTAAKATVRKPASKTAKKTPARAAGGRASRAKKAE